MFLEKDDLYTVIYQQILDEITRADDTVATRGISAAIDEVKAYLSRYDLDALFGTDEEEPTFPSEFLKSLVKDVAAWQVIKLSNPNIDYAHIYKCYEDATDRLTKIQKGLMNPQGWPLYVPPSTDPVPGNAIGWGSNPKRDHHF
jgi:hypothetical protein